MYKMIGTQEQIEQKIEHLKNEAWEIALKDKKLSGEDVKWLAAIYDAKKCLKWIHSKMIEKNEGYEHEEEVMKAPIMR